MRSSYLQALRQRLILAAAFLICVLPASAPAELMYVTEREFLSEVPLVVTASRLLQTPAKAPASITVIDRAMIEASTAIDIHDLLRLVPGFQVTSPNGHITSVMYHGGETAWSRRMQVLVDGRSVYNPMFSVVFWHNLDLDIDDIERIEVIRGPNAPAYGSNAFRAAINIITRQPFRDRGVSVRATRGSLETHQDMVRFAGGSGNIDWRVTVAQRADEGFDQVDDRKDLDMISMRAVWDPTANDSLDFQFGLTDGEVGAWGMNAVTSPVRDIDSRSGHGYLRWRHVFSPRNEAHLQLYHNSFDWKDRYEVGPVSALLSDRGLPATPELVELLFGEPDQSFTFSRFHGRGTRSDIEWQQTLILGEPLRLVWGAGYRRDALESDQVLGREGVQRDETRRLLGNLEWLPTQRWGFNAGLMIEDNDITGSHLSPRLAGNFSLRPDHTFRAVATRAVRFPSIYENYEYNVVRFDSGNIFMALYDSADDLQPETINSYEIGYRGLFADGRVDFDIRIFNERLKNLIFHARDPTYPDALSAFLTSIGVTGGDVGSFVMINSGDTDVSGAEFQLRVRPAKGTLFSLQYAYASIEGVLLDVVNDFLGDMVPVRYSRSVERSVPRHTVSALLSRKFNGSWHASLAYFHFSAADWLGDGQDLPRYNRWDARIGKGFSLRTATSDLSLVIQNLMDDEYQDFRRQNYFDRRVYVQFRLRG